MESRLNQIPTTAIYLTENECKQFVQFQKHYAFIGLLESIKAFDIRGGSVTVHFNKDGKIQGLDKKEFFGV